MFLKRSISLIAVAVIITASAFPAFASEPEFSLNGYFPIQRPVISSSVSYLEMGYFDGQNNACYVMIFRFPSDIKYLPTLEISGISHNRWRFVDSHSSANGNYSVTCSLVNYVYDVSERKYVNHSYIFDVDIIDGVGSIPSGYTSQPYFLETYGISWIWRDYSLALDSDGYSFSYASDGVDLLSVLNKLDDIKSTLDSIDSSSNYSSLALSDIYIMMEELRWNEFDSLLVGINQINDKLDSIFEALGSSESLTQPTIPNQSKYDDLERELIEGTVPNFSQYSEQVTVNGNALSLVIQLFDDIVHINPAVFSLIIISLVVGIITLVLGRNKQ